MTASNPWLENLLARLPSTGEAGEAAHRYLTQRRTRVRLRRQSSSGARWTLFGAILLNSHYAEGTNDAYALSLLVHEVHHLKQGWHLAFSVQGELEAWQVQFTYLRSLTGNYSPYPQHDATITELMALSPSKREDLKRARTLMQQFAGKKYRIDLYPLLPLFDGVKLRIIGGED